MTPIDSVGATGTKSSGSLSKLNSDFDMFLTLLTTQLRNQDPLDPMDNAEMTNQLVQFANVEQQIAQNTNLEQMIMLLNAQSAASAVGYIGKDIQFTDSTTIYSGSPITFGYTPAKSADTLKINVLDADGKVIRTMEGEKSAQRHSIVWDGLDDLGNPAAPGQYTFRVDAMDKEKNSILAETDITGRVTGAASDSTGNFVLVGDLAIEVTKIVAVREPPAPS